MSNLCCSRLLKSKDRLLYLPFGCERRVFGLLATDYRSVFMWWRRVEGGDCLVNSGQEKKKKRFQKLTWKCNLWTLIDFSAPPLTHVHLLRLILQTCGTTVAFHQTGNSITFHLKSCFWSHSESESSILISYSLLASFYGVLDSCTADRKSWK